MEKFAAVLLFFFLGLHGVFKNVEATSDFQDRWDLQNSMDFDDNRFDTEVANREVFNESLATTAAGSNSECNMVNPIDRCWRCDPNWEKNRQRLADCAIGFGKDAIGGKNGKIYVVTDAGDDPVSPKQGTLRHAVIQEEPLWIIFARDMEIKLKVELIMNNYKTIDGRGANVHIAGGPCITVQAVSHIIIHGIHIHDCKVGGNMMVRSTTTHVGIRGLSDGDGISLFTAQHVWIDHCFFSNCKDGIIDAVMESTAITISNNYFKNHDKVMLFGHSDNHVADKVMRITVAFNRFGEGLIERMPACRVGYFHVFNNDYNRWGMYAVGGSANPTINSQGNRFLASANMKEVTKRMANNGMKSKKTIGKNWNWRSQGDLFLNGAFFTSSGNSASPELQKATSYAALPARMVPSLTAEAGVLICQRGKRC